MTIHYPTFSLQWAWCLLPGASLYARISPTLETGRNQTFHLLRDITTRA